VNIREKPLGIFPMGLREELMRSGSATLWGTGSLAKRIDYGMCWAIEGFLSAMKKINEYSTLRNERTLVVEAVQRA